MRGNTERKQDHQGALIGFWLYAAATGKRTELGVKVAKAEELCEHALWMDPPWDAWATTSEHHYSQAIEPRQQPSGRTASSAVLCMQWRRHDGPHLV